MENIEELKREYLDSNAWGLSSTIDIYSCNPDFIRDKEKIKEFVIELCEKLDMKRFGEPQITHFGKDERIEGFSMVQLIETSLISGHFANQTNTCYLDIFSCKFYNPYEIAGFTKQFFQAKDYKLKYQIRK